MIVEKVHFYSIKRLNDYTLASMMYVLEFTEFYSSRRLYTPLFIRETTHLYTILNSTSTLYY